MRLSSRRAGGALTAVALALTLLGVAAQARADSGISIRVTLQQVSAVHHYAVTVLPPPPEPQGGSMTCPLPFVLRAEARDSGDALVSSYDGTADLTGTAGTVVPAAIPFSDGVWEGPVTVLADVDPPCQVTVADQSNASITGQSETFNLLGKGDPTGDGAVNALDLLTVLSLALGRSVPESPRYAFQVWAADMNCDGKVGAHDLRLVARKIRDLRRP